MVCPYVVAILDDVYVTLAESSTDDAHCADVNDPNARVITFRPFYFPLGFMFPLSKFFRKGFCSIKCAPSQCTLIWFGNSRFISYIYTVVNGDLSLCYLHI